MNQTSTLLYLSGDVPIENFVRERGTEFGRTGIMLTFFSLRQGENARASRRLLAMQKGIPYEGPKKRAARKTS